MPLVDPQILIASALLVSLVLFVTDALRYDMIAVLVVLMLASTRVLTPAEAFAGFAHPAVVLVASMYVFAAAVSRVGITELIGQRLVGGGKPTEIGLSFRVTLVAGVLSSILSNAAVVATLIPVLGMVARQARIPLSRLLMPLAYGSLLGGLCSVLGTSKNIAVNEMIAELGYRPFGLFEYAIYGFVLLALGSLYFIGPGRALLPRSREDMTLTEHYQVPKFITEVLIEPSSTLINRTVGEAKLFERYNVTLLGLVRSQGEASVLAPGPYNRIRPDDVLILQGDPDAILRLRADLNLTEREEVQVGQARLSAPDVQLVEAVVPAGSTLVGSTLAQAQFRQTTGCNVLAISKHGDVQPTRTADTTLDVGDTLLLQAHIPDVARLRERRTLIILDEIRAVKAGPEVWAVAGLLAFVLFCGLTNLLSLSVAALMAACGLVLFKLVRADEVRRTVDWSVLILIGGLLSLGHAFEKYHLDQDLAEWMIQQGDGLSPRTVLAVVLVGSMVLTQLMSHVAAAVVMTPVALSLAAELGVSERAFVMAVITGASFSFMSPVAHQANAMVMGPGDYRYKDFLRVGSPLTAILLVAAWFLLPVFFPL